MNRAYREVVGSFEEKYEQEQEKENEIEGIPVYEYMHEYLRQAKPNLQIKTYRSYKQMIEGKIKTYFEDHPLLTV